MGIPLYGRFWEEGADNGGEAIVLAQVEIIAKRYKCIPLYDANTGTPIPPFNDKKHVDNINKLYTSYPRRDEQARDNLQESSDLETVTYTYTVTLSGTETATTPVISGVTEYYKIRTERC